MVRTQLIATFMCTTLALYGCSDAPSGDRSAGSSNSGLESEFEIKGVKLGMYAADVMGQVGPLEEAEFSPKQSDAFKKLACSKEEKSATCEFTLANETVTSANFHFHENKLGQFSMEFDQAKFHAVAEGLRERYGEPDSKDSGTLTNIFGVEVEAELWIWKDGRGRLLALASHALQRDGSFSSSISAIKIEDEAFKELLTSDAIAQGAVPDKDDL